MMFAMNIHGMDVMVNVTHFARGCPMRITGSGFGDAEPPEDDEIEFFLKDAEGRLLDELITPQTETIVLQEYKKLRGIK